MSYHMSYHLWNLPLPLPPLTYDTLQASPANLDFAGWMLGCEQCSLVLRMRVTFLFAFCVWVVYVYILVHVCLHVCPHMCEDVETWGWHFLWSLSTLFFQTESLPEPGTCQCLLSSGIIGMYCHAQSYFGAGDLISGSHACQGSHFFGPSVFIYLI